VDQNYPAVSAFARRFHHVNEPFYNSSVLRVMRLAIKVEAAPTRLGSCQSHDHIRSSLQLQSLRPDSGTFWRQPCTALVTMTDRAESG